MKRPWEWNRFCLVDDRIDQSPKQQLCQHINQTLQASLLAATLSWVIAPALRYSALHSPAMYALFPLYAVSLGLDAYLELQAYKRIAEVKHRTLSPWVKARTATAVLAAGVAGVAVISWLLTGLMAVAAVALPHLVIAAFGLRSCYHLASLKVLYQRYQALTHPEDLREQRQALVAEGVKLGGSLLALAAVVGLLLAPFPPALLIAVVAVSAVVLTGFVMWRLSPKQWRDAVKQRYTLFKPSQEPDSPNVRGDEFGIGNGNAKS